MSLVNFPTNRVFMFTTARDTSEEAACAKNCLIALLPYCVIGSSTPTGGKFVLDKSGSTNQSVGLSVSLERNVTTNKAITQSGNKAILNAPFLPVSSQRVSR
jgi:hypothetical protein